MARAFAGSGLRGAEYLRSHGLTVRDVMSTSPVTVVPDTALAEVVDLMEQHAIKRIPVLEDRRVVGIVSRADLMSALGTCLLKPKKTVPATDDAIRRTIVTEMKRQAWCPVQSLTLRVRNGFVNISGVVFDERQRRALHVLVENIPGVKGIHEHVGEYVAGSAPTRPGTQSAKQTRGAARRSA